MKRLACTLVAFGLLLLQALPVRATLRMPATSECCLQARACCEHSAPSGQERAGKDCATCVAACTGCAVLPALDFFLGSRERPARFIPQDERGGQRRDPPPLPPPRRAGASEDQKPKT